jgi:hypothetical protein
MPKIDPGHNREEFMKQLEFQLDDIRNMTDECFYHCGFYFLFNNSDDKEKGQDMSSTWYKGAGSPPGSVFP